MKLIIVIVSCMFLCSCKLDYSNDENFWHCSDKMNEAADKCAKYIIAGNLDSALYWQGKSNAYYEMESRFIRR